MSEYAEFSRWISEVERQLSALSQKRESTEARIAKKINHLVQEAASNKKRTARDTVELYNRLNRMAKCLEAEDTNMATLEQVEKEVDRLYGDQSDNSTFYFHRASAEDLKEMEALTTYDPAKLFEQRKDVLPTNDHDSVRREIESDWSDFSRE